MFENKERTAVKIIRFLFYFLFFYF